MSELLRQYFRIAVLAGRPQDLPGGVVQMQIGLALAAVTYLLALVGVYGVGRSVAHVVVDLGGTAIAFRVALSMLGRPERFEQAFGGLCGASAVVNAVAIPVYLSRPTSVDAEVSASGAFVEFALLVWSLTLLAHVVRHTFELRLVTSVGIAFLWLIVLVGVMDALLPVPAPETVPEAMSRDASDVKSSVTRVI